MSDLQTAAQANIETGLYLLQKEALTTAILDKRLGRLHLRVLACISIFMNPRTAKSWPSRASIAEILGLSPDSVGNKLRELRVLGYLVMDRERVEEAENRSLAVYTLGNIDHETIRREITNFVMQIRSNGRDRHNLKPTQPSGFQPANPPMQVASEANPPRQVGFVSNPPVEGGFNKQTPINARVIGLKPTHAGGFGDVQTPLAQVGLVKNEPRNPPNQVDSTYLLTSDTNNLGSLPLTVPATEPEKKLRAKRSPANQTRLPKDWFLTKAMGDETIRKYAVTAAQVRVQADKFKNSYLAAPDSKGKKHDWDAQWWVWCGYESCKFQLREPIKEHAPDLLDGISVPVSDAWDAVRAAEREDAER